MATQPEYVDLTEDEDTDLEEGEVQLDKGDIEERDWASEPDEVEGDEDEAEEGDRSDTDGDEGDEMSVSFAGVDIRDEDEPEHISDLRRRYREEKRRREELEAQVAPKIEDIGKKPNLDEYWDKDDPQGEFERDLLAWNERKREAETRQERQREEQALIQREYEADLGELQTQRQSLKVRDFDAAEERVTSVLNDAQQAILVQVAKNKAALLYALGKNPERLAGLASVKNLAKFAGEVARLDMETRVSRKPATKPEGVVRGSGSMNGKGATNAKLEQLEREAERTGNRSKVIAYKRKMKNGG